MNPKKFFIGTVALALIIVSAGLATSFLLTMNLGSVAPAQVIGSITSTSTTPSVDLTVNGEDDAVNVSYGTAPALTWTSTGVDSCVASVVYADVVVKGTKTVASVNTWTGATALEGTKTVNTITNPQIYVLTCKTGATITAVDSVAVNLVPSIDLKVNGADGVVNVPVGASSTLSWRTSGVTDCTASLLYPAATVQWSGRQAVSGSKVVGSLVSSEGYILTCTSWAGVSLRDMVVVNPQRSTANSNLTLSSNSTTQRSESWRYTALDGVHGVAIGSISLKSDTGDSIVNNISVSLKNSSTAPSTVYLYDGAVLVDSRAFATNLSFQNLDITVPKDTLKVLTIKVDMPSNTATGSSVSLGVPMTASYQSPNGTTKTVSGGAYTYPQYFYPSAPKFTFVSGTAVSQGTSPTGTTTSISAQFVFKVNPVGASMLASSTARASVKVGFGQGTSTTNATVASVTVTPNDVNLADGGEYTVTVATAPLTNTSVPSTGTYTFFLNEIDWTMSDGSFAQQQYGFNTGDWKTNAVNFVR